MDIVSIIIGFEVICAVVLAGLMAGIIGVHPVRAMLKGLEVLAFMVVSVFPAPYVRHDARHRAV